MHCSVYVWVCVWGRDILICLRISLWVCFCTVLSLLRFTRECAIPPHLHPTSTYDTARDKFYQAFRSPALVLQAAGKDAWERGYLYNRPDTINSGHTYSVHLSTLIIHGSGTINFTKHACSQERMSRRRR